MRLGGACRPLCGLTLRCPVGGGVRVARVDCIEIKISSSLRSARDSHTKSFIFPAITNSQERVAPRIDIVCELRSSGYLRTGCMIRIASRAARVSRFEKRNVRRKIDAAARGRGSQHFWRP
jgi:hypothetical protein